MTESPFGQAFIPPWSTGVDPPVALTAPSYQTRNPRPPIRTTQGNLKSSTALAVCPEALASRNLSAYSSRLENTIHRSLFLDFL